MKAAINFTIYKDFSNYLLFSNEEYDYNKALEELNEVIKNLVDENKLIFTYNGMQVNIITPILECDTGNIFDSSKNDDPCWDNINIWCEIPVKQKDFNGNQLKVSVCPDDFYPKAILW